MWMTNLMKPVQAIPLKISTSVLRQSLFEYDKLLLILL